MAFMVILGVFRVFSDREQANPGNYVFENIIFRTVSSIFNDILNFYHTGVEMRFINSLSTGDFCTRSGPPQLGVMIFLS